MTYDWSAKRPGLQSAAMTQQPGTVALQSIPSPSLRALQNFNEQVMTKTAVKKKSIYGVHPGVAMTMKWVAELKQSTGRSLDEWIKFIKKEGPPTEEARRDWLKQQHGLGTNSAWWLAERSVGKGAETGDPDAYLRAAEKYVDEMFAGKKEHLRPIYDALLRLGLSMGKDTKACPCQTIVPLYRNHVFAQIKPTTQTRIVPSFAEEAKSCPSWEKACLKISTQWPVWSSPIPRRRPVRQRLNA
jgi:hypothetical protein